MALNLKPRLERSADGRFAAAIYIDGANGQCLGLIGPAVHDSEHDARSMLRSELQAQLDAVQATIVVDGIEFGRDIERALEAVIFEAGTALLEKLHSTKPRSGPVAIADASAAVPVRRAK